MISRVALLLLCALAATASTYDADLAMKGWFYSKAAFCDLSSIQSWTCQACANNSGVVDVTTFHDGWTGAQAYTGYNAKTNTIVLAYRGSADIQNWIYNLDFFLIDYPNADCKGCQVHRGFLDVYNAVKSGVFASLTALTAKYGSLNPSILVTGHSLGGALAILAAADVSIAYKASFPTIRVYTYGEPRVGNPAWAYWMSTSILPGTIQFRVTHKADPVPRIPPEEFGFLHVPHEVWYNNDLSGNTFTTCVDSATSEDMTNCENTQFDFATADHLLYLGVHAGCHGE